MSTNLPWEIHKAIIHSVGFIHTEVIIPAILGRNPVSIPHPTDGEHPFAAPNPGEICFVAVRQDRKEVRWPHGPMATGMSLSDARFRIQQLEAAEPVIDGRLDALEADVALNYSEFTDYQDFVSASFEALNDEDAALDTRLDTVEGVWTSYTPTIYQNVLPTFTTQYCKYRKVGRTVNYSYKVTATSSGTLNNRIGISLPFQAANFEGVCGAAQFVSAGGNHRACTMIAQSPGTIGVFAYDTASDTLLGNEGTFQITSGAILQGGVTYESLT